MIKTPQYFLYKKGLFINYETGKEHDLGTIETSFSKNSEVYIEISTIYTSPITALAILKFITKNNILQKKVIMETVIDNDGYQKIRKLDWLDEHKLFTRRLKQNGISFHPKTTIHLARLIMAITQNVRGYEAHHKDYIRNHNHIDNIELKLKTEHKLLHRDEDMDHYHSNGKKHLLDQVLPDMGDFSVLSNSKDKENLSLYGCFKPKSKLESVGNILQTFNFKCPKMDDSIDFNVSGDKTSELPELYAIIFKTKNRIEELEKEHLNKLSLQVEKRKERAIQNCWNKQYYNEATQEDIGEALNKNNIVPITKSNFNEIKELKEKKLSEYEKNYDKVPADIRAFHFNNDLVNLKESISKVIEDLDQNRPPEIRAILCCLIETFNQINTAKIKPSYYGAIDSYYRFAQNYIDCLKEFEPKEQNKIKELEASIEIRTITT